MTWLIRGALQGQLHGQTSADMASIPLRNPLRRSAWTGRIEGRDMPCGKRLNGLLQLLVEESGSAFAA